MGAEVTVEATVTAVIMVTMAIAVIMVTMAIAVIMVTMAIAVIMVTMDNIFPFHLPFSFMLTHS
jgi:hypothetical protein